MKAFAAVTNGTNRIRCRFNRKKTGHGTKVFALTKPYYLLFAMGNVTGGNNYDYDCICDILLNKTVISTFTFNMVYY